jgi:hypothetical protein
MRASIAASLASTLLWAGIRSAPPKTMAASPKTVTNRFASPLLLLEFNIFALAIRNRFAVEVAIHLSLRDLLFQPTLAD